MAKALLLEKTLPKQKKILSSALDIDGYKIQPVNVKIVSMNEEKTVLNMELYEGRNRQIRRMCEAIDNSHILVLSGGFSL